MSLTDQSIYWVVAALFMVALVGGAFVSWLIPRRWWGIPLHGLVIVVASALVAVAGGLTLNQQNAWYDSLNEVFGNQADPQNDVVEQPSGAAFAGITPSPAGEVDHRTLPPLQAPGKALQDYLVPTTIGGSRFKVKVLLPNGYFDPANATRTYPVVVLGPGYPGKYKQWTDKVKIADLAEKAYQDGAVGRFIAVLPDLYPDSMDTECLDGPAGAGQMEVFLAKDVPAFVQARFRVRQDRTSWAWMGISTGGYCAVAQTLLYPQRYSAALSLGGYLKADYTANRPPFPVVGDRLARQDLVLMARRLQPKVALWLFNANQERKDVERSFALRKAVPKMFITLVHAPGAHSWDTWIPRVPMALKWLGKEVPGFAKGA